MVIDIVEVAKYIAIGIIGSAGLAMPAFGIAFIGREALKGIARNPEASRPIQTNMILSIAFCEAIGIYALIIAIILLMIA